MIYLLSGLLVIHGIICLLGAFIPFYPPIFLLYYLPLPLPIRLIIVLVIGAAQVVFGGYLALKQKRK